MRNVVTAMWLYKGSPVSAATAARKTLREKNASNQNFL